MHFNKLLVGLFAVCLVAGIGLTVLAGSTRAGDVVRTCNRECFVIINGCDSTRCQLVPHETPPTGLRVYRCDQDIQLAGCDGPFDCECRQISCVRNYCQQVAP